MTHPEVEQVDNFHILSWKGGGEIAVTMGMSFEDAWHMLGVLTDINFDLTQIRRAIRNGSQYYPNRKSVGNLVGIAIAPFSMSMEGVTFYIPGRDGKSMQVKLFNAKPAENKER